MERIESKIRTNTPEYQANVAHMKSLVMKLKEEIAKARLGGPEEFRKRHKERGKLLAHERLEALIDPDTPFLELSPLAAYGMYDDPPSAGIVTGIGVIPGARSSHHNQRCHGQRRQLLPAHGEETLARAGSRPGKSSPLCVSGRFRRRQSSLSS